MQMIENKVKSYYNDVVFLRQQIVVNGSALENYKRLLNGENTRFTIGESSVFLINSRELKFIEAQQKVAELRAKFFKSYAGVQWAAGQLR
jgi:outer membrane protein TolC